MSAPQHRPVRVRVSKGRHTLRATAFRTGADLVVVVGGGDRPHVGCVALGVPHPSSADPARCSSTASLLAIPPHREGELASRLAARLARTLGVAVVVAAGIHTDALDADGIAIFTELADRLEGVLLRHLGVGPGAPAGS